MNIEGPMTIGIVDTAGGLGRELQIDFKPEFKAMNESQQAETMRSYIAELGTKMAELEEADPNRAGMLVVQQISAEMLPYIEKGEMALNETIVVQIGEQQSFSLTDLMN